MTTADEHTTIVGLSAYYHDSAAAVLRDGKIVAAAQEERFTRKKHDAAFPQNALAWCLEEAGCSLESVSQIVFYDKPLIKFERLLETYLAYAPRGFRSFAQAMPIWLKEKLFLKRTLREELANTGAIEQSALPPLLFAEHHQSHAASAFYFSPCRSAAVLCMDGVGEWETTSAWQGSDAQLTPLWELRFPHSLGLLYSAFTYFTGFRVNSGEYKLMGLAPYGHPRYADLIREKLIDVKPDGSFRLAMQYFDYCTGLKMTNDRFASLFDGPARKPESKITQREMDLAASIQKVTEDVVLRLANTLHEETGETALCLAGGVALNCVANGRLLRESRFDDIWIQPAAGDAGGAIGSAAIAHYEYGRHQRQVMSGDAMGGTYLGPKFSRRRIHEDLESLGAQYVEHADEELLPLVAKLLDEGNVIGWFNGRMEFGPRALGARSILGDPRSEKMQSVMNLKIKYRESFRPFAPSVIAERANDVFDLDSDSPYMLIVAQVAESLRVPVSEDDGSRFGIEKLNVRRSELPAITHVDYSARVQTVHKDTNPRYYALLRAFEERTGCPVLVNTSFNVRGEPIVCTPVDAYRCFMRTEMDYLVIESILFAKSDQPPLSGDERWRDEFALD